jgi:hypothetical protein
VVLGIIDGHDNYHKADIISYMAAATLDGCKIESMTCMALASLCAIISLRSRAEYRTAGIFARAKFRGIACYCFERICRGFNFRAFSTWRPYPHRLISNFAVNIVVVPDLSMKNAKFCTTLKFPGIQYTALTTSV